MNLDYSMIDQINAHKTEQEEAEWEELKATYKQAGELEAKIMVSLIAASSLIATFILETPH